MYKTSAQEALTEFKKEAVSNAGILRTYLKQLAPQVDDAVRKLNAGEMAQRFGGKVPPQQYEAVVANKARQLAESNPRVLRRLAQEPVPWEKGLRDINTSAGGRPDTYVLGKIQDSILAAQKEEAVLDRMVKNVLGHGKSRNVDTVDDIGKRFRG
jgi:hypothetical protein